MSIDRWLNKEDVVYTHTHTQTHTDTQTHTHTHTPQEYYSAMKNNEVIPFVATWMDLLLLLLLLSLFSHVRLCATPETAAHQAPPSPGFSRQEHWSGLPFPSPMHESEKWNWNRLVVSDSSQPHGLQSTRLLCPWDFPGQSTGVGCHCLLQGWT